MTVCLRLSLSVRLSVYMSVCLFACRAVGLLVHHSVFARLCQSRYVSPLSLAVSVCLCLWCLVACEMQPISKNRCTEIVHISDHGLWHV